MVNKSLHFRNSSSWLRLKYFIERIITFSGKTGTALLDVSFQDWVPGLAQYLESLLCSGHFCLVWVEQDCQFPDENPIDDDKTSKSFYWLHL